MSLNRGVMTGVAVIQSEVGAVTGAAVIQSEVAAVPQPHWLSF